MPPLETPSKPTKHQSHYRNSTLDPPRPAAHHIDPPWSSSLDLLSKPTTHQIHHRNSAPDPQTKPISKPITTTTKTDLQTHNHADLTVATTTRSLSTPISPKKFDLQTHNHAMREGMMRKWVKGQCLVRGMGREKVIGRGMGEKDSKWWERESELKDKKERKQKVKRE